MYSSYSSFGSYHSFSSAASPLDIPQSSYLSTPTSSNTQCAFPSWPRRDSLSGSEDSAGHFRATSFLSDEDLLPDPFEDDNSSIASSGTSPNACSPIEHAPLTDEQVLQIQREREAMQRELARFLVSEKQRRKQAAKKKRKGNPKKSAASKLAMSIIAE